MTNNRRRKAMTRRQRNIFVIVCEGEKTEINYFNGFNERYSTIVITPLHGRCTDPRSIVKYAYKEKKRLKVNIENGDRIWCVFDVDSNTNHDLRNTLELSEKYDIPIALSNPCFELWLILHYFYHSSTITHREAPDELRRYISDYEKGMDIFDLIKDQIPNAIENAILLNRLHDRDGTNFFSTESNPSSQVYRIIEEINNMKNKSNQD